SISWPLIGLSFYVSNMSGSSFVGLPASGYATGVSVFHYEWLPVPILLLFALFILPSFLRARIYTTPEFLERRYHRSVAILFSAFLLFANIFIDAAAALYAGGAVLHTLFPELPLWVPIYAAAALAGLYIF